VQLDAYEAFALFWKNNSGPVFRALLVSIQNRAAAEDAGAEAFARALAHWDLVAVHPNPRAWVLRTARNCYNSSWRKWEGRRADLVEPVPIPEPWVDVDLVRAIARLPKGQREVVALRAFGELTPAEIADVLGQEAGTVRGQLSRARAALREALGETTNPEERDA
jgi:DNA-directed RNA polymerase specialized sigma24 family protein